MKSDTDNLDTDICGQYDAKIQWAQNPPKKNHQDFIFWTKLPIFGCGVGFIDVDEKQSSAVNERLLSDLDYTSLRTTATMSVLRSFDAVCNVY